jgi:predicted O-methyltransferase YrrM
MVVQKALRGFTTANLKSLRFLSQPNRFLGYLRDVEEAYQFHNHLPIKSIELGDLLGRDFAEPLFLPLGHLRSGSSPVGDLAALAALTKKKRPRTIFEIGTFEGLSAVVFAKNAGADVVIHTLDLPHNVQDVPRTERSFTAHSIAESYASGYLIDSFATRKQTNACWGDSAIFDFQPFEGTIDLFFVDGAHTEDYVASDSCNAFDSIASDGWVLWHDCFTPQVLKVLKQIGETTTLYQIRGTNLVLIRDKPGAELRSKYRKMTRPLGS